VLINNQNKLVNFQNEIENSGLKLKALKSGEKIAVYLLSLLMEIVK